MFSIEEIIDLAIQIEQNGERIYRDALQKISNPSLSFWLQRLADEEAQHAKWFTEMKDASQGPVDDPRLEQMGQSILRSILGDQAFSLQDIDFSSLNQIKNLFELGIEFEKDTVLFYEMIRDFIEDEITLIALNTIIEEENRHIQLIQGFLESGEMITDPDA
jgi:rubrerythrin